MLMLLNQSQVHASEIVSSSSAYEIKSQVTRKTKLKLWNVMYILTLSMSK